MLVVLAICATVLLALLSHTSVLEWRSVMNSQITTVQSGGQPTVRISGFCGHSALSVKDISVQRSGAAQLLTVRVFLARRGTTGDFQVDVPVLNGINEIRFGRQKVVVWQRSPK